MLPASSQALLIVVFAIAPGFAAIRGFSRRRYRTVPDRDLYAIAGSLVLSAIWLGVIWLILLEKGDPLHDWGVVPYRPAVMEQHEAELIWLALGVICLPFPLGSLAAIAMDLLELVRHDWLWRSLRWTGFFKPPTAWDRGWLQYRRDYGAGRVLVRMREGLFVLGSFGRRSAADLSPNPPQLFLEQGYVLRFDSEDGNDDEEVAGSQDGRLGEIVGTGTAGIYVPGEEIEAVIFLAPNADESLEPIARV